MHSGAELVGPDTVCSEGGMCGTYIRTTGTEEDAVLNIHADGLEDVQIRFTCRKGENS